MVVPHTSWHDFYLGIFTRGIIGLKMNFIGSELSSAQVDYSKERLN